MPNLIELIKNINRVISKIPAKKLIRLARIIIIMMFIIISDSRA